MATKSTHVTTSRMPTQGQPAREAVAPVRLPQAIKAQNRTRPGKSPQRGR